MHPNLSIALLVPCHNEAITIATVIKQFQATLPHADIYVYDNNSTDETSIVAANAGAIVRKETYPGKGSVVRRMFADIDADIYVLVDGDATYDAKAAPSMIQTLIENNLDMVVGIRKEVETENDAYRAGHRSGNLIFNKMVATLFGKQFKDIFSGYRVFSKRFVKSFPAQSNGFEIETELSVHSLELRLPCQEVETDYIGRPEGSESKLNKYSDGLKILRCILMLLKSTRPLFFFGSLFLLFAIVSLGLFSPVFISYMKTGMVARFPTAILSTGIMLLAFMSLMCGLILDSFGKFRRETKRLRYLAYSCIQTVLSHRSASAETQSEAAYVEHANSE